MSRSCASCRLFVNDPVRFEAAFPGLLSFGSGSGSNRDADGLCLLHERHLAALSGCASHEPRVMNGGLPAPAPPWQRNV